MARINYEMATTESHRVAAALCEALDLSVNPVTIHEDRILVAVEEGDAETLNLINLTVEEHFGSETY